MVASIQSIEKASMEKKHDYAANQEQGCSEQHLEQTKYELISILQSSLDLSNTLEQFFLGINKVLRVDGMCFLEEERDVYFKFGKQSTHSCGYRLISGNAYFGELTLRRGKRFSDHELEQIESLLILLLVPIGNALKYADAVAKALREPLISITGRSEQQRTLQREIELAKRHNHPLSLMMIRIESEGNKKLTKLSATVVSEISTIVQTVSRGTDILMRTGGKEFLLLLHNDIKGAGKIARRIEKAISKYLRVSGDDKLLVMCGHASLTGTDSAASLRGRAKKDLLQ